MRFRSGKRFTYFLLPVFLFFVFVPAGLSADTISKVFNYPNPYTPANGTTTIVFKYERIGPLFELDYYVYIYNLVGHRVMTKKRTATIDPGPSETTVEFTWNGKTDKGDTVPPGVYYVRIVTDGGPGSAQSISKYGKMMIK